MNTIDITALLIFFAILITASVFLGKYMMKVFTGTKTFMTPVIRPLERLVYKVCSVDESSEMSWKTYAWAFILFNHALPHLR